MRVYLFPENQENRKVIFVDKPLPCKAVRSRLDNHMFHKYSLLSHLQHPNHHTSVQLANQPLNRGLYGN